MHKVTISIRCWLLFVLLLAVNSYVSADEQIEQHEPSSAHILLTGAEQVAPALLLETEVSGEVAAMFASIQLRQRFMNTSTEWVNGQYVFPLPTGAAIDSLTFTIGDRVINAVVKERQAAKAEFKKAKAEGRKAGLLEQQRPNLFTMAIANIPPQAMIVADITYVQTVDFRDGEFSLRLPTTLTPRYIAGRALPKLEEQTDVLIDKAAGWATATDSVPDAAAITPPQVRSENSANDDEAGLNTFDLLLVLDIGLPLRDIVSDSHNVVTTAVGNQPGDDRQTVSLAKPAAMDRDFILRWRPVPRDMPAAAVFQQQFQDDYYSLLMLTPPTTQVEQTLPRDLTFIIDSSGSMSGASMRQALESLHQALDYLTPQDRFNIIDFDDKMNVLFNRSQPVTQDTLNQARSMISGIQAGGGTEMFPPLQFALAGEQSTEYLKQIVFITDGSIGNEQELFELIHNNLRSARLFTVGIGSAPNSHFMRKAAQFGRGVFVYIGNTGEVNQKMADLFRKLKRPLLRDLEIDWPANVEVFPKRIPDLYDGEPLVVIAKSKQPLYDINVRGQLLQQQWLKRVQHTGINSDYPLDDIWVRRKIANLMDQMATGETNAEVVKPQVIKLGVDHQLITRYTSFIAVEKQISRPKGVNAKGEAVANLMPKGSTMAVPVPQTATPVRLLVALAAFFILVALLLRSREDEVVVHDADEISVSR